MTFFISNVILYFQFWLLFFPTSTFCPDSFLVNHIHGRQKQESYQYLFEVLIKYRIGQCFCTSPCYTQTVSNSFLSETISTIVAPLRCRWKRTFRLRCAEFNGDCEGIPPTFTIVFQRQFLLVLWCPLLDGIDWIVQQTIHTTALNLGILWYTPKRNFYAYHFVVVIVYSRRSI